MTFTVVIPTYNRLPLLMEALESVRRQTHLVDEIIVVDDGSTDGTWDALQAWPGSVRCIRQENAGPAAARNRGMREAKSDWIALLDSDDLWLPDKLATQKAFLEQNPSVEFLFAHMTLRYPVGEADGPEILDPAVYVYCREHARELRELVVHLFVVNPVPTSSVVFKRAAMERVGFIREDLRCAEDYDWWLRWALTARCGFLDHVVVKRRIHGNNIIGDRVLMLKSTLAVLTDLAGRGVLPQPSQQSVLQVAIHQKRYALACECYQGANYTQTIDLLRHVDPRRLGSKVLALKWLAKLAAAFALGSLRP